jgi:hypothetical protein
MSEVTIEIPWEDDLKEGPVGEYVDVIDIDPGSSAAYAPVDLNAPALPFVRTLRTMALTTRFLVRTRSYWHSPRRRPD